MMHYNTAMNNDKKPIKRAPRGKSPRSGVPDRAWLQAELERVYGQGWNKKGANEMGIDPSDLTRLTRGQRRWTAEYISRLQRILRRPLDEIYRHVGVSMPPAPSPDHVTVTGTVDQQGRISPNTYGVRSVPAPPGVIDSFALMVRAPLSPTDGWVLYYDPRPENPATLVGRLAVVRVEGRSEPLLGVLRRGGTAGTYSVMGFVGESTQDVDSRVLDASPIVWVKTGGT